MENENESKRGRGRLLTSAINDSDQPINVSLHRCRYRNQRIAIWRLNCLSSSSSPRLIVVVARSWIYPRAGNKQPAREQHNIFPIRWLDVLKATIKLWSPNLRSRQMDAGFSGRGFGRSLPPPSFASPFPSTRASSRGESSPESLLSRRKATRELHDLGSNVNN